MSATATQTLTLRDAYEQHYLASIDLATRSRERYRTWLSHWERITGNPCVTEVTNETVAAFRQSLIDEGYAAASVNGSWKTLRTIFRLLGPQETRNPWGLGILDRIPAMRPVKGTLLAPYRIPLEDIDRTYRAADVAEWPLNGIPPADFWRALFVVIWTTGLRRGDIQNLRWIDVDFERGELEVTARKTGKHDVRKLHPVAIAHLQRIYRPTKRVFHGLAFGNNGNAYKCLRRIQQKAGVKRLFTFRHLRKTAGSEIERIRPGCGELFLQHAPRGVSDVYYLNRSEELDEAILAMRLPPAFTDQPPAIELPPLGELSPDEEILVADLPIPNHGAWAFRPGAFRLEGRWFPMRSGTQLMVLSALAISRRPVTSIEIGTHVAHRLSRTFPRYQRRELSRERARGAIAGVRDSLRRLLGVPDEIDPVPCVQSKPAAWSLYLPNYILDRIRLTNAE